MRDNVISARVSDYYIIRRWVESKCEENQILDYDSFLEYTLKYIQDKLDEG
ncbi:MAG: hypothetical protein IJF83_07105 [Methanobrevibacter sp.]|uniref:hypothetical protein n=1 Tax=Methanobrevibacter sp. TaxID=66852 RepID=UPI00386C7660|nr:hypothetical protein [Methanobrevibacter sp.]